MSSRFRAFYIGALVVAGIGLVGTSFAPHAQAVAAAAPSHATAALPTTADHTAATSIAQRDLSSTTMGDDKESHRDALGTEAGQISMTTPSLPRTGGLKPLIGLLGLSSLSFAGLLALATRSA